MKEKKTELLDDAAEKPFLDKKNRIRLIAAVVLTLITAFAFAYGITHLLTTEPGYQEVEATAGYANCASDFVFAYDFGASGESPTAESKALKKIYNERVILYYRLFNPEERFDEVVNVASLNASPNTEIEVPRQLYRALEVASGDEGRNIYLAPFFEYYELLYASKFDEDAASWDPQKNDALREEFDKTLTFASSDEHVRLELRGDGKVFLFVSDEYKKYADEVGITSFIDFGWMKNAFIADAFADEMTEAGYTHGVIYSKDGYVRNFDLSATEYTYGVYAETENGAAVVGALKYSGGAAICPLNPFILDEAEESLFYVYSDGSRRTRYISVEDALPHDAAGATVTFSKEKSCSEMLLSVLPYYQKNGVREYSSEGVGLIYYENGDLFKTDAEGFTFTQINQNK